MTQGEAKIRSGCWLQSSLFAAFVTTTTVAAAGHSARAEEAQQETRQEAGAASEAVVGEPAGPAEPGQDGPEATETPEAVAAGPVDILPRLRVRGKRNPDAIFGDYRVRIALARPKFDDGLKFYDELYGKPALYPMLAADWFAWDWYATLGLSFRMGYYTAQGYTAKVVQGKAISDVEAEDIEKDKNGPTSLTLLPFQLALTAEMTPFKKKWLVLDGWIGMERLYFQEVRTTASESKGAVLTLAEEAKDGDDALTNKGWRGATVVGASANILLNPLGEGSANSMRGSMGLGYVYLSPFVEIVRTKPKNDGEVSFGRTSMGVGFTFETTH